VNRPKPTYTGDQGDSYWDPAWVPEWDGEEDELPTLGAELQFRGRAESAFMDAVQQFSGQQVDADNWRKGYNFSRRIEDQSVEMARKLESAGVDPWQSRPSLKLVGVCSGLVRELPNLKDWNLFPVVARRKRKKMVKHVNWFMDTSPEKGFRMWTLTSGKRFAFAGVEDFTRRWEEFNRGIARLNDHPKMKEWGFQILLRANELIGSKNGFQRDALGTPTFHLHAHLLVAQAHVLNPCEWDEFLHWMNDYWGHHWDESGSIRNSRELVKYMAKPLDLLDLTGEELNELREYVHGKQFVRPMGDMRKRFKELRELRLRVDLIGESWRTAPDWNSIVRVACDCTDEVIDGNLAVTKITDASPKASVVAITLPAPVFAPMREPCFLVANWDGESDYERTQFQQEIAEAAISIYTTSLISTEESLNSAKRPDPPPKELQFRQKAIR